jgi:hypothetical protein
VHDAVHRVILFGARPPIATERLALTDGGNIRYTLKTPYRDGTTHVIFEPLDFMPEIAHHTMAARPEVPSQVTRAQRQAMAYLICEAAVPQKH